MCRKGDILIQWLKIEIRFIDRCKIMRDRSKELMSEVDQLASIVDNKTIQERIRMIGFYVENIYLYTSYVVESSDGYMKKLLDFAKLHTSLADGASIQDDYLKWRMGWMPKNFP